METVVFTGGGTGGHIYPGLAVAFRLLSLRPCRIVWIASSSVLDRGIVEKAGIEFLAIPSGKLRRYFSLKNISDIFRIAAGFFASRKILKRLRPSFVFSKGGFVSVPPCAAARSLGIPVFTHESDYSPGLATRINTRFAQTVFVAYEDTKRSLGVSKNTRILVSGNPVREVFRKANAARGRSFTGAGDADRILLVLGGSQGARQVNELIVSCLDALCKDWFIVHQTGAEAEGIPPAKKNYLPLPFIHEELPDILAASSLVLGRSGAGTIWEAAAAGKPLLLIPLCGSGTRGDQVENAAWFCERGAALSLVGSEANPRALMEILSTLVRNPQTLAAMAERSRTLGEQDASEYIVGELLSCMKAESVD